ncbi:hypothetical protein [Hymenobacter pini]|uniref:hypothetical protein n=1 Tax=Hymenobacter pini TaxID=2880879 RepID=UPI001CF25AB6|nr:hypothetical protein [Hymenobacter pini]MCA8831957.1 hypothetical protein [Hymenobacter pini]
MKALLKPKKLLVCQTATGHPVRIVWLAKHGIEARVVSLKTGMPIKTTRGDLFELK